MEDLLYELSVVGIPIPDASSSSSHLLVDAVALDNIRNVMTEYDEKREVVIKTSRDVQKASKNAIYSIHRGDLSRADELMKEAKSTAGELAPLLRDYPLLREGSYSDAMEEYAEAVMFKTWITEKRLVGNAEVDMANSIEFVAGMVPYPEERGDLAAYHVS